MTKILTYCVASVALILIGVCLLAALNFTLVAAFVALCAGFLKLVVEGCVDMAGKVAITAGDWVEKREKVK